MEVKKNVRNKKVDFKIINYRGVSAREAEGSLFEHGRPLETKRQNKSL